MKYVLLIIMILLSTRAGSQEARYDIKPELFWLEEYSSSMITPKIFEYLHNHSFIYYEPISNQYYFATIKRTNNIIYKTNEIRDEQNFIDYQMSSPKMPLTYIGSINLTNRIYIDTDNNQYIKTLMLIEDKKYYISTYDELHSLSKPVYPYARHYDGCEGDIYEAVRYFNGEMDFYRDLRPHNTNQRGQLMQTCGG
ncbi:MAG: hypothetical protein ACRC0X_09520 [Brevinema sp.]